MQPNREAAIIRFRCRATLVRLDINMPEMFGDQVAAVLRQVRGMTVPIWLFSNRNGADLARRVAEAQADGFVSKDAGIDDLVRRVKTILEGTP